MKRAPLILLSVFAPFLLGGCGLAKDEAELISIKDAKVSALVYTSSLRAAYIREEASKAQVCAEPAPDVALDTLKKLAAELQVKIPEAGEGSGKISSEISSKIVQLAGRTQLVLLARELLYRSCELSLNRPDVPAKDVIKMFDGVVKLVGDLGAADRAVAETQLLEAQVKAKKIIAIRQTHVDAIVSHVSKADKSIDKDKLKALLDKADGAKFVREFIEEATDADDLSGRLRDVSPKTLEEIAAGIN